MTGYNDPWWQRLLCRFGLHDYVRRSIRQTPRGKGRQCARWDCMKWRDRRGNE